MATVTKAEVLAALGVPEQQFDAFIQRGMLLTARDAIDSQVRNAEKARDEAYAAANAEIENLQIQRTTVQAQIDAL